MSERFAIQTSFASDSIHAFDLIEDAMQRVHDHHQLFVLSSLHLVPVAVTIA
jgi:hypothetical protein